MQIRYSLLLLLVASCGGKGGKSQPPKEITDSLKLKDKPVAPKLERKKPMDGHQEGNASDLLDVMAKENARWMNAPAGALPPMYYLSYQVFDERSIIIEAQSGAIVTDRDDTDRQLDTEVRVGSKQIDNTTTLSSAGELNAPMTRRGRLPLSNDNAAAIAHHLWLDTDRRYKEAQLAYRQVEADVRVRAKDNRPPDFVSAPKEYFVGKEKKVSIDKAKWTETLKQCSKRVHNGVATRGTCRIEVERVTSYYVNSEGTKLQQSRLLAQLTIGAGVKADDGMQLRRMEQAFAEDAKDLLDQAKMDKMIDVVSKDLLALHSAPIVDPYVGPAILQGKAAAVFFHEVFGHRMEGHRQTSDESGQTFTSKVGKEIMPTWLSVFDDPSVTKANDFFLNGFYRFDDEGVAAQRVELVKKGKLTSFLQGRHPIKGFPTSNGHGRKQPGAFPVSRQGNLFVTAEKTIGETELEKALLQEVKRQGKPFGMVFTEISGGFTNTTRFLPQAFKVNPVMAYRIYPDGRRELVRGVDIVGTPLTALANIMAASNKLETFNGMCGAESGWVPVSASAPSLLLKNLEVERGFKPIDRPPVLSPPTITKETN